MGRQQQPQMKTTANIGTQNLIKDGNLFQHRTRDMTAV